MKRICGIYGIRSICKPGRVYIGSSTNIRKRWSQHRESMRKNNQHNSKLQNHYNKYGKDDLIFEIILQCDKEIIIKAEQAFIDLYHPWFNVRPIADNNFGVKHSEEMRQRNRARRLGSHASEEAKKNMSLSHIGSHRSAETKRKMSIAQTGKRASPETREKLRLVHIGLQTGENHPMWGKHPSEETRRKQAEAHRGEKSYNYGQHLPETQRKKISENHANKKCVINIETGIFYDSIRAAADTCNITISLLYQYLCGHRKNKTMFRYA